VVSSVKGAQALQQMPKGIAQQRIFWLQILEVWKE
jgi:hypothetical protein